MKKIALISMVILSVSTLQGCALAVIGAGASATKVAIDPRTTGTQIDDTTLDTKVSTKLSEDKEFFKGSRIVGSAYNSNVVLVGQAKSQAQIDKAVALIQNMEGVNKVYDQIRITDVVGLGTITSDSWITTKVKTKLISDEKTKARDIKVITENGEVFLIGIVTRDEGQIAAEIASKVDGVSLVTKIFTYID